MRVEAEAKAAAADKQRVAATQAAAEEEAHRRLEAEARASAAAAIASADKAHVDKQEAASADAVEGGKDAVVETWIRGAEELLGRSSGASESIHTPVTDAPPAYSATTAALSPAPAPAPVVPAGESQDGSPSRVERAAMFEAAKRLALKEVEAIEETAECAEMHRQARAEAEMEAMMEADENAPTPVIITKERGTKLGIGLVNMGREKGQCVGSVTAGSAAAAAGITPGLYIHAINGESTVGLTHSAVIQLLAKSPKKLVLMMGLPLDENAGGGNDASSPPPSRVVGGSPASVASSPSLSGRGGRASPLSREALEARNMANAAHAASVVSEGAKKVEPAAADYYSGGTLSKHHRSDSLTSLVSVAPENFVGKKVTKGCAAQGALKIYLKFEPDAAGKGDESGGLLVVRILNGYKLTATQPYVKLYLSKSGKDIKNSKRKTRTCRKHKEPAFNEQFTVKVPQSLELSDDNRLQISVWDHARLKANECVGSMSFSLLSLASTSVVEGWFDILEYDAGRKGCEVSDPSTVPYDNGYDGTAPQELVASAGRARTGTTPHASPSRPGPKAKKPPTPLNLSNGNSSSSSWGRPPADRGPGGGAIRVGGARNAPVPGSTDIATRLGPGASGQSDLLARIAHLEEKNARSEYALQATTTDLWTMKEQMAQMRWQWAATLVENVEFRHKSLGATGIGLRTALILTPETGSLGLEIKNDPQAKYTGVRVSHTTPDSPAAAAGINAGDVLIAVNGGLQLGSTFDEVIAAIVEAGAVIVLSLATGSDVDAPGSPFWDVCDDGGGGDYSDSDEDDAEDDDDGEDADLPVVKPTQTVPQEGTGGTSGTSGTAGPNNWL